MADKTARTHRRLLQIAGSHQDARQTVPLVVHMGPSDSHRRCLNPLLHPPPPHALTLLFRLEEHGGEARELNRPFIFNHA